MKKTSKYILCVIIVICLCVGSNSSVWALTPSSPSPPTQATTDNSDEILIDFGMDEDQVLGMDSKKKLELAQSVLVNPDNVDYSETVSEVDEIMAIETVVNSSDDELLACGMEEDDVVNAREIVDELMSMNDEEIKESYGRNDEQIKLLRVALEESDDYYVKNPESTVVSSSGNISTSQLTFTLTTVDTRSSTCKAVSYWVGTYFRWNQEPYFQGQDEIAMCWGGNLNSKDLSRDYYNNGDLRATGNGTNYAKVTAPNWLAGTVCGTISQTVNAGIVYKLDKGIVISTGPTLTVPISYGYTYHTLYQEKRQGYSTKVLAQYGHRVPSFWVSSFSFTSLPSINIGEGLDTSNQLESTLIY